MQNTREEVVIPRKLARELKALVMALEEVWEGQDDTEMLEAVRRIASELINAEKLHSEPAADSEIAAAKKLIPCR